MKCTVDQSNIILDDNNLLTVKEITGIADAKDYILKEPIDIEIGNIIYKNCVINGIYPKENHIYLRYENKISL
jgi:hypothetical protein